MQMRKGVQLFSLIVITLITSGLFIYAMILQPQKFELLHNKQAVEELLRRQTAVRNFYEKHNNIDAYAGNLQERITLVNGMLPNNMAVNDYMLELQTKASASGIMLTLVKPGKMKAQNNYVEQELSIAFQADYYQLNDFLCRIEQTERFANVIGIQIKSKENGPRLECNVNLAVFALKE